jgi:RHS repeat-associated protein
MKPSLAFRCIEIENAAAITQAYPAIVTAEYQYDAWGLSIENQMMASSFTAQFGKFAATNRYKYNDKEYISDSKLYDYGARHYDAVLGRWWVVDPLAEKGPEYSTYSYTFNNPLKYTDPDGRWPWPSWSEIKKTATSAYNSTINTVTNVRNTVVRETKAAGVATSKFVKENQHEIKNVAKAMQNGGDAMVLAGTAATMSIVGAEVGVPAVAVGAVVSGTGTFIEGIVDLATQDYGAAGQKVGFEVAGTIIDKAIDKAIPGPTPTKGLSKNSYELGKRISAGSEEAGKEIYKQVFQLKTKIVEKTTEMVQEQK